MTRTCLYGGALVPADRRLPSCEAERRFGPVVVGCNRLRCADCGEPVKSELTPEGRRYACACTTHVAVGVRELEMEGRDLLDVALPWRCAGHPEAVEDDLEVLGYVAGPPDARVRAALHGAPDAPADLPPSQHRGYMVDLYADLVPDVLADVLAAAEDALEGDDDEAVRRGLDLLVRRDAVPVEGALLRWRRLSGRTDPYAPSRELATAWADAIGRLAIRSGADSEAAAVARVLRRAGAKARVLRSVPG